MLYAILLCALGFCVFSLFAFSKIKSEPKATISVAQSTSNGDGNAIQPVTPNLEAGLHEAQPVACEVRAAWINPLAFGGYFCDDPTQEGCRPVKRGEPEVIERINVLLDELQSAHLNTLLVASPSFNGNCGWANRFAFEDFIELAKQRGFSLHLWVANKERADPSCNDSQMDFTDPQEKYRQADWIIGMMDRYGNYFDGVHLDFIRYSDWEPVEKEKMWSVDPTTGEEIGVTATVKQISLALRENYPGRKLTASVKTLAPDYARSDQKGNEITWKEDVPQWFIDWFNSNPGNWYAVAEEDKGKVPLQMKYQQDAISWLRESFVDGLMVMEFTIDDDQWNTELGYWKTFANYKQDNFWKVFMGIGWDKNFTQDPGHVVRKTRHGRANGLKGFSIFQFSAWDASLNSGDGGFVDDTLLINALTIDSAENDFQAPYKDIVPSCLATQ